MLYASALCGETTRGEYSRARALPSARVRNTNTARIALPSRITLRSLVQTMLHSGAPSQVDVPDHDLSLAAAGGGPHAVGRERNRAHRPDFPVVTRHLFPVRCVP